MGWETRGGRRYYYQAARQGGRVVKRYVGRGGLADCVARLDAVTRQHAADARRDRAKAARRRAGRDRRAGRVLAALDAVLAGWLAAAGFHRPKRGAWRARRGVTGEVPMDLATRKPLTEWREDALRAGLGGAPPPDPKTGKRDPAAVAEYLAARPAAVALFGDLTRQVVEHYAAQYARKHDLVAAAVVRRADDLRHALAGSAPTPVEVLLAERAAVCWVAAHVHEQTAAALAASTNFKAVAEQGRLVDAAHRRLLSSLKTLATVRRLKLPDVLAVVAVAAPA